MITLENSSRTTPDRSKSTLIGAESKRKMLKEGRSRNKLEETISHEFESENLYKKRTRKALKRREGGGNGERIALLPTSAFFRSSVLSTEINKRKEQKKRAEKESVRERTMTKISTRSFLRKNRKGRARSHQSRPFGGASWSRRAGRPPQSLELTGTRF